MRPPKPHHRRDHDSAVSGQGSFYGRPSMPGVGPRSFQIVDGRSLCRRPDASWQKNAVGELGGDSCRLLFIAFMGCPRRFFLRSILGPRRRPRAVTGGPAGSRRPGSSASSCWPGLGVCGRLGFPAVAGCLGLRRAPGWSFGRARGLLADSAVVGLAAAAFKRRAVGRVFKRAAGAIGAMVMSLAAHVGAHWIRASLRPAAGCCCRPGGAGAGSRRKISAAGADASRARIRSRRGGTSLLVPAACGSPWGARRARACRCFASLGVWGYRATTTGVLIYRCCVADRGRSKSLPTGRSAAHIPASRMGRACAPRWQSGFQAGRRQRAGCSVGDPWPWPQRLARHFPIQRRRMATKLPKPAPYFL